MLMELHRRGWNAADSTNLHKGRNCGQVLEHSNKLMVCLNVRIAFSLSPESYAVHNTLCLYPGPNCMLHNTSEEQFSGWSRNSTPPHPTPSNFTKTESSLPCSQQSTSCLYPDLDKSSPRPARSILIFTSHLHLSHHSTSVLQDSPQILHAHLFSPIMTHALSILSPLILPSS
jgi:hypothetical protein